MRELSEVYLLMDHLSGRWDKRLIGDDNSPDNLNDGAAAARREAAAEPGLHDDTSARYKAEQTWIERICEIGWPNLSTSSPERAKQAALLLLAKDRLNAAAKPASGMTIAFTLMVTGDDNSTDGRRRSMRDEHMANGGFAQPPSRSSLAAAAFPGLVTVARKFNQKVNAIVIGLCAVLLLTCFLSWSMASGYTILARLDALYLRQSEVRNKIWEIEKKFGVDEPAAPAQDAVKVSMRYCVSAKSLPQFHTRDGTSLIKFNGPELMHLCDELLAVDGELLNSRLSLNDWLWAWRWSNRAYIERQRALALYPTPGQPAPKTQIMVLTPVAGSAANVGLIELAARPDPVFTTDVPAGGQNASDEEWARVFVPLLFNSVLPIFYGVLGAGTAVLRHLRTRTKESLLSPRDMSLAVTQLVLGATIGACIGLFVAQSASPEKGAIGFITFSGLTGSALSFIAGFGVEGVFAALESLVRRVFNLRDPAQKN